VFDSSLVSMDDEGRAAAIAPVLETLLDPLLAAINLSGEKLDLSGKSLLLVNNVNSIQV
jgi:hypothetical protein